MVDIKLLLSRVPLLRHRPAKSPLSCLCALLSAVLLAALMGTGPVLAQQNLPSMGEPVDNALSPIEERELGAQFMRQIRARLPLIRDVQINEYMQSLGNRLALASGKTDGHDFTFFIIDDDEVNAFAIPGGYVGFNVGLISVMDDEEQLAGVVAHEVAHVTQRHHARAYATGNRASMSAAAAVLAAILIGQASPGAGQAALAAGLAATQQSAINFTRGNEIEADRIGIEILANAQYDASAMAESFAKLRRRNSLNQSSGQLEYLRTHPLDNNRIAEAADRAAAKPRRARAPRIDYDLFKARLMVLTSEDSGQSLRSARAGSLSATAAGAHYMQALLHLRGGRLDEAEPHVAALEKIAPAHPMVVMLRTDLMEARGQSRESDERLAALSELYPQRYSIVEKRLDQLFRARRHGEALAVVNQYLRTVSKPNPLAWRQLASIQQRLGRQAGSHESLARYFEGLNELQRASSQLELALRQIKPGSQDELRLQASLKALEERARSGR